MFALIIFIADFVRTDFNDVPDSVPLYYLVFRTARKRGLCAYAVQIVERSRLIDVYDDVLAESA